VEWVEACKCCMLASCTDGNSSPLMIASFFGHKKIVEVLLELGANINEKSANNMTALLYALQRPK
jgi:ankyrin repeat protein